MRTAKLLSGSLLLVLINAFCSIALYDSNDLAPTMVASWGAPLLKEGKRGTVAIGVDAWESGMECDTTRK